MQIVIDIPEEIYFRIMARKDYAYDVMRTIKAVERGKVLPEGHGRLIDADAMKTIKNIQSANFNAFELIRYWIDNQPTIIEADREEEE